ncbi:MAG: hypothetical protein DRN20_03490 [Thermoplasmata archaeon]|nr:MAG: hypothetical protein DRN20_03490 [Thermoplasmata archaeon]
MKKFRYLINTVLPYKEIEAKDWEEAWGKIIKMLESYPCHWWGSPYKHASWRVIPITGREYVNCRFDKPVLGIKEPDCGVSIQMQLMNGEDKEWRYRYFGLIRSSQIREGLWRIWKDRLAGRLIKV